MCSTYYSLLVFVLLDSILLLVKECLDFIYPVLRHAIDLIQDKRGDVAAVHSAMQGNVSSLIESIQS